MRVTSKKKTRPVLKLSHELGIRGPVSGLVIISCFLTCLTFNFELQLSGWLPVSYDTEEQLRVWNKKNFSSKYHPLLKWSN